MSDSKNTTPAFDLAALNKAASALAVADKQFDAAIPQAASAVARILGEKPTFDAWNAVAEAFQKAYREARGCEEKTAQNRWSAVCTEMERAFALAKPAKPSAAGKAKAAQRAKHEKAVKAARAQCVKPADAFSKAAELVAAGKVNEAKVYTEAGHQLAKEVADKASKAASEQVKKLRDSLKAELAKCTDEALLKAALELIRKGGEAKPAKSTAPRRVKKDEAKA